MKLSKTVLSIPPYLSVGWSHVVSLRVTGSIEAPILVVELTQAGTVEIPGLDSNAIEAVFNMHAQYLEERTSSQHLVAIPPLAEFGTMTTLLNHDVEQCNIPPLPQAILEKIADLTKAVMPEGMTVATPAEPHCQCPHCQIVRAMQDSSSPPAEEEVTDADLQFASWHVRQQGDRLYAVTNPLDAKEQYNVFLGNPVGCTCGTPHCDHIKAVLES